MALDRSPFHFEGRMYSFEDAMAKFVLTYADSVWPSDLKASDALDLAISGTVGEVKGTLVKEESLTLRGVPAKSALIAVDDNTVVEGQFLSVKPRVYQLLVLHRKGTQPPFEQQFFDSFTIPTPVAAASSTPSSRATQDSKPGGSVPAVATSHGGGQGDSNPGVYRVGGDVTAPKATYAPDPVYSEEARQAKYEGTVVLWMIVSAEGLPQDIKVQRSLGMGLDEEAIKAVTQWRFEPATKDGKPVPVMINVEVNFRLPPSPGSNGVNSASQATGQEGAQDYQAAKKEYEKAAAAGDATAMRNLGALYYYGYGVPQNYEEARKWFEKAAANGNAAAMRTLGGLYHKGEGVPQDYEKAKEWSERAAAAGDAVAMKNLGYLYYKGEGVPQDYNQAKEWFEKAAAAGNDNAMIELAGMYYQGKGVPRSYQKSKEWLEKSAAAGNQYAQLHLREMLAAATAKPERANGISMHMLPKRVADIGGTQWGLTVAKDNLSTTESEPPVLQTTEQFLSFVRKQDALVQDNGVWIVVTDPDAYSSSEKTLLEDIKSLCQKEKIPLFICRAKDLPNGWKRCDLLAIHEN